VLNDGRFAYLRWEYCDLPHAFSGVLFHMNPDGTGPARVVRQRVLLAQPDLLPATHPGHPTKIVGITHGHHDPGAYGNLVAFDPSRGRRGTDGAVQRIPGYGEKVEPVLADWMNQVAPLGTLRPPVSVEREIFLVSAQLPSNPEGTAYQGRFGIYLVDVFDNIVPLCRQADCNLFEPIPIRPAASTASELPNKWTCRGPMRWCICKTCMPARA